MGLKDDSVFFISGAANGIGRKTAEHMVAQGHRVIIADIEIAAARRAAEALGARAFAVELDVREPASWARALDQGQSRFGPIHVLINNAGLMNTGFLLDQADGEIRQMMEVNLWGLACGLRAGAKFMLAQGYGHLITMSSMASFVSLKGQAFYSATKHGVRSLHYAFAMELEDTPLRLSIIHPGAVETAMLEKQVGHEASALSFAEATIEPERIAAAVYKAARSGAKEITVPGPQGFFARFVGIFPGLLALVLGGQWKRGLKKMEARRGKAP